MNHVKNLQSYSFAKFVDIVQKCFNSDSKQEIKFIS